MDLDMVPNPGFGISDVKIPAEPRFPFSAKRDINVKSIAYIQV
jgi:hypothetical protein